jgi:hypothetical protein
MNLKKIILSRRNNIFIYNIIYNKMNIDWALLFTFIVIIVIILIAYLGANLRLFPSIALALLFGLITLNLSYPPNNLVDQEANPSLWVYGIFEIVAVFILLIYILKTAMFDGSNCEKVARE